MSQFCKNLDRSYELSQEWKCRNLKSSTDAPMRYYRTPITACFRDFKDTHRENTPSNKIEALTKSINMYIRVIGTLNHLFIRGSYTPLNFFLKKEVIGGRSPFFVIGPFCTPHSVNLNIGFWQSSSFVWECCTFELKNGNPVL